MSLTCHTVFGDTARTEALFAKSAAELAQGLWPGLVKACGWVLQATLVFKPALPLSNLTAFSRKAGSISDK